MTPHSLRHSSRSNPNLNPNPSPNPNPNHSPNPNPNPNPCKVPACLNLINKSKAYLVLDRAWVPDLTLDFDYYGCVMQYAGKVVSSK